LTNSLNCQRRGHYLNAKALQNTTHTMHHDQPQALAWLIEGFVAT
jgi:hypothetical protein